ncbi:MAG TPA: glycoside hydrolase family 3 N-terminal domain-containing protein, partial [Luteimonas sp.]|nr:glycoside hydrolase family 3 N-terminal domain-containing protein [Luteimonas sp.]
MTLALPAAAATPSHAVYSSAGDRAAEKAFVDALMAKMTLEEKLGQLNQPRGLGSNTGPAAMAADDAQIAAGAIGSILGSHGAERTCRLQRVAVEQSRLGIPLMFASDV